MSWFWCLSRQEGELFPLYFNRALKVTASGAITPVRTVTGQADGDCKVQWEEEWNADLLRPALSHSVRQVNRSPVCVTLVRAKGRHRRCWLTEGYEGLIEGASTLKGGDYTG